VLLAPAAGRVELRDGQAEPGWVAADLVEGDEPAPAVVRGVLDALGHDHSAGLLEPNRQLAVGHQQPLVKDRQQLGQVGP